MIRFLDENRNKVEMSFFPEAFNEEPMHVLVICQLGDSWLLTNHKQRGVEFPGGKREPGETLEDAARRETYEETGGIVEELAFLAKYKVYDKKSSFVKTVFYGKIKSLVRTTNFYETNGPVIVTGNLLQLRFGNEYSFIMKDQVVEECIKWVEKKQKE